jgi:hypothetical protein
MKILKEIICLKCNFFAKEWNMKKMVETQELQSSPPLESSLLYLLPNFHKLFLKNCQSGF